MSTDQELPDVSSRAHTELGVAVIGATPNGPCLMRFLVVCTAGQYANGDHYDAAIAAAAEHGYSQPMVTVDERDPAWKDMIPKETAVLYRVDIEHKPLDPTLEELYTALELQPGDDEDELEWRAQNAHNLAAIYWYANLCHGGQASNLYAALSQSVWKPGPINDGPESEGELCIEAYNKLCDHFGGEYVDMDLDTHEDEHDDEDVIDLSTGNEEGEDLDTVEDGLSALARDLNEFRTEFNTWVTGGGFVQPAEGGKKEYLQQRLEGIVNGAIGLAEINQAMMQHADSVDADDEPDTDDDYIMRYDAATRVRLEQADVHPEDIDAMMNALQVLDSNAKLNVSSSIMDIIQEFRDAMYELLKALRDRNIEANASVADQESATQEARNELERSIQMARQMSVQTLTAVRKLQQIVITKSPDEGVILLPEADGQLGTALMELYELLGDVTVLGLDEIHPVIRLAGICSGEVVSVVAANVENQFVGLSFSAQGKDGMRRVCYELRGKETLAFAEWLVMQTKPGARSLKSMPVDDLADVSSVNRFVICTTHQPPMYLTDWAKVHDKWWTWSTAPNEAYQFQDPTKIRDTLSALRAANFQVITYPVQE